MSTIAADMRNILEAALFPRSRYARLVNGINAAVDRYAAKKSAAGQQEFRWITIGGASGDKGEHEGGTPVKIEKATGKIVAGPKALADKGVEKLSDFGKKGEGGATTEAEAKQPRPAAPATDPTPAKEPWQMTREEFVQANGYTGGQRYFHAGKAHEDALWKAFNDHKSIPDDVLEDFPELKKAMRERRSRNETNRTAREQSRATEAGQLEAWDDWHASESMRPVHQSLMQSNPEYRHLETELVRRGAESKWEGDDTDPELLPLIRRQQLIAAHEAQKQGMKPPEQTAKARIAAAKAAETLPKFEEKPSDMRAKAMERARQRAAELGQTTVKPNPAGPKSFAEIGAEHTAPIVADMKSGDMNAASQKFDALMGQTKAKQFEAHMLRQKLQDEAGIKQKTRAERKAEATGKPPAAPAPQSPPPKPTVAGTQSGLFDRDEMTTGQKSLFNVVRPAKGGAKNPVAPDLLAGVTADVRAHLERKGTLSPADVSGTSLQAESLEGQKEMFSRVWKEPDHPREQDGEFREKESPSNGGRSDSPVGDASQSGKDSGTPAMLQELAKKATEKGWSVNVMKQKAKQHGVDPGDLRRAAAALVNSGHQRPSWQGRKNPKKIVHGDGRHDLPEEEIAKAERASHDALVKIGAQLRAESAHGSRYYELPGGRQVRVSDHPANEATSEWMDRSHVEEIRTDRRGWEQSLQGILGQKEMFSRIRVAMSRGVARYRLAGGSRY